MAAIVQFIHPGPEHGPGQKGGNIKSWNDGKHKRKFLLSPGEYVQNGLIQKGELCFWGEWEPPSAVEPLPAPARRYPNWLHRPYLPKNYRNTVNEQPALPSRPSKGANPNVQYMRQNTDPFVFGKRFLYGICQQSSAKTNATNFTAKLPIGSLILFGTGYREGAAMSFHLDTVFVIGDFIAFDTDKAATAAVATDEEIYRDISLKMACPAGKTKHFTHRLYRGATWNNRLNGMYSFSPAKVYNKDKRQASVFSPVIVRDSTYITDTLTQKYNANVRKSNFDIAEVKKLWESIRDQCRKAGCVEGVHFDMPPLQ
jgi:hypothetical protein